MLKFLHARTTRQLIVVACVSAVGLVAFGAWMNEVMAAMDPRILGLELAFTPGCARAILEHWGDTGQKAALESLRIDIGFIVAGYVPLLFALCLLSARAQEKRWWRLMGEALALLSILAGVLDLVENWALWCVLSSPSNPMAWCTWAAGIAAAAKFLLALAAALYALAYLGRALHRATPLVQWLLSYPLLVFASAVLLAILWHVALASFGIPDLFWDVSGWMQMWAGIGVGTLLVHFGVMGFLMDTHRVSVRGDPYREEWCDRISVRWAARVLPITPWPTTRDAPPPRDAPALLASYLLRTSLPLLLVALGSFLRAPGGVSPWVLPIATAVSFYVALRVILWFLARHVPVLWDIPIVKDRVMDPAYQNLHRLAQVFVIIQVVIYLGLWVLHAFGWGVSVALAVCLLLGGIASVYGFLKYFFAGSTFGVVAAGFVAFVGLQALGGHHLPGFDYCRLVELNQTRASRPESEPTDTELDAWLRARGVEKPPLIVVAVDGGGIRAAVWANVVMAQLERDVPRLPYFVRIVTGASGGMVGMASYVASLQEPDPDDPDRRVNHRDLAGTALRSEDLIARVARESLGAVARTLVFQDLLLPPFLHPSNDRGTALENQWETDTGILGQEFAALAAGEKEGWRPSLIVSPMIIEDGRRLLISNLELGDLSTIPVASPSLQALQYFGHIESRPGRLKLSTAVRLNASFPYVSPAAQLPTRPARHTLDAGYYDEHGVDLAGTWIWTHRDWLRDHTGGVLLIQIPDARAREAKKQASEDRKDWWGAGILAATGPIEALRRSQSAAADYRNDQLVRFLQDTFNETTPRFFTSVVFEPDETDPKNPPDECRRSGLRKWLREKERPFDEVALSWRLTPCEVKRLETSFAGGPEYGSCKDRKLFEAWWNEHKPKDEPPVAVSCGTIATEAR